MKTNSFKIVAMIMLTISLGACTGGNQGVHETGSADSDAMMNTDTQMVDTAANSSPDGTSSDTTKVPVPTP